MKILVTGANGQVGASLGKQLENTAWDYKLCDRQELDISNPQQVFALIESYGPDVIINAAAYTAVDKAELDPLDAFTINEHGVKNLADAVKKVNGVLLHISTDYVFSGDKQGEYSEGDVTDPQGIYGRSKLAGETAVQNTLEKYIILRTAWVFGEHGNNFVKTMLRLGRERDRLGVVADQFGGPTYAGDIAAALLKICSAIESNINVIWGTYHFTGLPHVSWYEFAKEIFAAAENADIYSKSAPIINAITTADYPTPAKRPFNSRLDCSKLNEQFSILPSDWKHALKNIKAYV